MCTHSMGGRDRRGRQSTPRPATGKNGKNLSDRSTPKGSFLDGKKQGIGRADRRVVEKLAIETLLRWPSLNEASECL